MTAFRLLETKGSSRTRVPPDSLYEGLKHSTARRLKSIGADDRLLAQPMGHRDPWSVEKYAKLQGAELSRALRRLRERDRS